MIVKLYYANNNDRFVEVTVPGDFIAGHYCWVEKPESKYREWVDKLGPKLSELSLQQLLQTVYDHDQPQYSRIQVIKALRVIDRDLGLKEAKDISDSVFPESVGCPKKGNFE